jgi:hypothetical protein
MTMTATISKVGLEKGRECVSDIVYRKGRERYQRVFVNQGAESEQLTMLTAVEV